MTNISVGGIKISYNGDITFNPDFLGYVQVILGDGPAKVDASALAVNVSIRAGDGTHNIVTGSGDDLISLGAGSSTVDTGDGNDFVTAQGISSYAHGGAGDKIYFLNGRNSTAQGGAGNDTLGVGQNGLMIGGGGHNTFFLGVTATAVSAGGAADHINVDTRNGMDGAVAIQGFHGGDVVDLSSLAGRFDMLPTDLQIKGDNLIVPWIDLGGVSHTITVGGVGKFLAAEGVAGAVQHGDLILATALPPPV